MGQNWCYCNWGHFLQWGCRTCGILPLISQSATKCPWCRHYCHQANGQGDSTCEERHVTQRGYAPREDDCTHFQLRVVIYHSCSESWTLHPSWTCHTWLCCMGSAQKQKGVHQGHMVSGLARYREGGGDISADGGSSGQKYCSMFCCWQHRRPWHVHASICWRTMGLQTPKNTSSTSPLPTSVGHYRRASDKLLIITGDDKCPGGCIDGQVASAPWLCITNF